MIHNRKEEEHKGHDIIIPNLKIIGIPAEDALIKCAQNK